MSKKYPQLSKILKKLLFEKEMKPVDLSRKLSIPQPTIHRLITGKSTRPYKSSLQPIADFFSLTVEQLLGEEKLVNNDRSAGSSLAHNNIKAIPLIPWKLLGTFEKTQVLSDKQIAVNYAISDKSFALIMPDSSMEPLFPTQSILIFDPMVTAHDRSYVLVKLHSVEKYVFRQLLIDVGHQYIKSLNPDLSSSKLHLLNKKDEIMACLVESRNNYLISSNTNFFEEN